MFVVFEAPTVLHPDTEKTHPSAETSMRRAAAADVRRGSRMVDGAQTCAGYKGSRME